MFLPLSDRARELLDQVMAFMDEHVYPNEARFHEEIDSGDRWQAVPVLEEVKAIARERGLWNLFLPESELGAGLTNYEYAHLCEQMGRSPMAPESFNCSAPDTGNMEVLVRYGTDVAPPRVARSVARGRDPILLRDDRARRRLLRRHEHLLDDRARRRRVRHQRPEVVDLRDR